MGVTLTSRLKSCLIFNSLLSPFLLYFIFSFTLSHLPTPLKYIILLSECLSPSLPYFCNRSLFSFSLILFFSHSLSLIYLLYILPSLSIFQFFHLLVTLFIILLCFPFYESMPASEAHFPSMFLYDPHSVTIWRSPLMFLHPLPHCPISPLSYAYQCA